MITNKIYKSYDTFSTIGRWEAEGNEAEIGAKSWKAGSVPFDSSIVSPHVIKKHPHVTELKGGGAFSETFHATLRYETSLRNLMETKVGDVWSDYRPGTLWLKSVFNNHNNAYGIDLTRDSNLKLGQIFDWDQSNRKFRVVRNQSIDLYDTDVVYSPMCNAGFTFPSERLFTNGNANKMWADIDFLPSKDDNLPIRWIDLDQYEQRAYIIRGDRDATINAAEDNDILIPLNSFTVKGVGGQSDVPIYFGRPVRLMSNQRTILSGQNTGIILHLFK